MTHVTVVIGEEPGIPAVGLARNTLDQARKDYSELAQDARVALRKPDLGNPTTETDHVPSSTS